MRRCTADTTYNEFHDVGSVLIYPDCYIYPWDIRTGVNAYASVSLKFTAEYWGKKCISLVGQNGAGKTTLIKLLCRLYEPTEVILDHVKRHRYLKYNYEEYTRAFSVVFQDFAMFSLPVGENIAASSAVDEERAWEVLDQVELSGRVRAMKDGLKTQLQ